MEDRQGPNNLFLEFSADKRKKSNGIEAKEPIHYAAMFDALDAVKLLISLDVSADQPDNLHQTPLFIAARNGMFILALYVTYKFDHKSRILLLEMLDFC